MNVQMMKVNYRVTHKEGDFRDDCTEFVKSVFLHFGVLEDKNWHISVLNHCINHQNTQLNAETKNRASHCYFFLFLACFFSLILCGTFNPWVGPLIYVVKSQK